VVAGLAAFSPALLILWVPGLFRLTCYYIPWRVLQAFWADRRRAQWASAQELPGRAFISPDLKTVHRYFLYLGMLLSASSRMTSGRRRGLLTPPGSGGVWHRRRTLVLAVNVGLLAG